jgi:hypothetical protein
MFLDMRKQAVMIFEQRFPACSLNLWQVDNVPGEMLGARTAKEQHRAR